LDRVICKQQDLFFILLEAKKSKVKPLAGSKYGKVPFLFAMADGQKKKKKKKKS
jgi:hypothetical protein